MMRSLFSGVSGLKVHQTRMDNIGNNIANINTVGFKSTRTTFADMLSQTQSGAAAPSTNVGGTNPKQIGLGVSVASMDLIFTDGSPQSTGKNTDVALSGNGLFVVQSGTSNYYTRDGAFSFDESGYYVLPGSGMYVLGWNAVDGALNTNSQPERICVPSGKTMEASQSNNVTFTGNLNANIPLITQIDGSATSANRVIYGNGDSAVIRTDDGNTQTITAAGTYRIDDSIPISTIVTVYDSQGAAHQVPMLIEKVTSQDTVRDTIGQEGLNEILYGAGLLSTDSTATTTNYLPGSTSNTTLSNVWMITLSDSDVDNSTDCTINQLSSGDPTKVQMAPIIIQFDEQGNYSTCIQNRVQYVDSTSTKYVANFDSTSSDDGNARATYNTDVTLSQIDHQAKISLIYTGSNGAETQTYLNYVGTDVTTATITKSDGTTVNTNMHTDPNTGEEKDNRIAVNFSDLITQYSGSTTVYPTGDGNVAGTLQSVSVDTSGIVTGTYTNGLNRFEAQLAVAQFTNSAGLTKTGNSLYAASNNSGNANIKTAPDLGLTITPSALEMSNVDLANEFSEMIITQRGFQANSKIINVGDEMLETLVNMKR